MSSALTYLRVTIRGFDYEADQRAHLLFTEFWSDPFFPEDYGYSSTLLAI